MAKMFASEIAERSARMPSRSTAATATPATSRLNASTAMCVSRRFTKAPTIFSGWLSVAPLQEMKMAEALEFYFDFSSPYGYLAAED